MPSSARRSPQLVEGVTKLTRVQFQSREQAEAENYRKLVVAMAKDLRVILIKLADRLHNLRTIEYMGKQTQVRKARETLEVYAPLAHRLGIHALKWELEDLAFGTLHPRKYEEIKQMVAERRADREEHVREAALVLQNELDKVDIPAEISGRAKHFYSIYDKMASKGREFNEIYDLTAMRVIVERSGDEGTRDCYGALGLIHSLWKPMPGRFKDFIAMPKFNGYRALHTTVIGPQGRPLEIQVRTREMHETAEYGVAAHWIYKAAAAKDTDDEWTAVGESADGRRHDDEADQHEFMKTFRTDLFDEEVHVFTPKGQVKTLPAGSTPIDFAYAVHTDVGNRTVGAKVNGRIVPLHYQLQNGDQVEILTSKQERGPSRDWLSLAKSSRARNKIRQWYTRETREEQEAKGRESLEHALKQQNLPYAKLRHSAVLAQVIRDPASRRPRTSTSRSARAAPAGRDREQGDPAAEDRRGRRDPPVITKAPKAREHGLRLRGRRRVQGVDDVLVRLAKCCTPVPGDPIVGYISLGRGITIHREDCPNVRALQAHRGAVHPGRVERAARRSRSACRSRSPPGIARGCSRTSPAPSPSTARTSSPTAALVEDQLAKNWYTAEVGDMSGLRSLLNALRAVDAVFDAYRVTPS